MKIKSGTWNKCFNYNILFCKNSSRTTKVKRNINQMFYAPISESRIIICLASQHFDWKFHLLVHGAEGPLQHVRWWTAWERTLKKLFKIYKWWYISMYFKMLWVWHEWGEGRMKRVWKRKILLFRIYIQLVKIFKNGKICQSQKKKSRIWVTKREVYWLSSIPFVVQVTASKFLP